MSVNTKADDCLADTKQNIEDASTNLFEAMKSNTWGYEHFSDKYITKMQTALIKLLEINQLLK